MPHLITRLVLAAALLGLASGAVCATTASPPSGDGESTLAGSNPRVVEALRNVRSLQRPGYDGFATIWDGDKYVQCGATPDHGLRCEAAGAWMQPSLAYVLTPERLAILTATWRLDPSFGNYVRTFPAKMSTDHVANSILWTLVDVYGSDLIHVEVESDWIRDEPCPPRNGPSQNLAGMINDAPAMAATAVHACAYMPAPLAEPAAESTDALVARYGARVTGEIQRLWVNADREVYVIFDADIGYVQCQPEKSPASVYCEAESADSWPALASVLNPERIGRLHAMGFADPGRSPNYWKIYPADQMDDAAIAREVLSVLHDVYGYAGSSELSIVTEKTTVQ